LSPADESGIVNFIDFNEIGSRVTQGATAFKKIQYHSKINPQSLFNISNDYNLRYNKISNLYMNDLSLLNSSNYGTFRQHNYVTPKSLSNTFLTKIDNQNINKFLNYNYSILNQNTRSVTDLSQNNLNLREGVLAPKVSIKVNEMLNIFNFKNNIVKLQLLNYPTKMSIINSTNDQKHYNNPLKYTLNSLFNKKSLLGKDYTLSFFDQTDLNTNLVLNNLTSDIQNTNLLYRFRDLKSNNLSYLASEKNVRLLNNISAKKFNPNFSTSENNVDSLNMDIDKTLGSAQGNLYLNSNLN